MTDAMHTGNPFKLTAEGERTKEVAYQALRQYWGSLTDPISTSMVSMSLSETLSRLSRTKSLRSRMLQKRLKPYRSSCSKL
jgi:hypothetical protein